MSDIKYEKLKNYEKINFSRKTKIVSIGFVTAFTFLIMGVIGYFTNIVFSAMLLTGRETVTQGMLYPRESETREVRSLDGIWNFVKSNPNNPTEGIKDRWYENDLSKTRPVQPMPVPASYNDVTEDSSIRDHVGTVWYDRRFFIPTSWAAERKVWIRFGSVHYESFVWINGELAVKHEFGHLPFEAEITKLVKFGQENRVTVLCDNVLIQTTIPQGKIVELPNDYGMEIVQTYTFDFFNYAGIHRSVMIYTTPNVFVSDVIVSTDIDSTTGIVNYKIVANVTDADQVTALVQIRDKEDNIVVANTTAVNEHALIYIHNVKPWWPFLMDPNPGYLYKMEIFLSTPTIRNIDVYRLKIGVRSLSWNSTSFLINGKPIYFRGFGRHEDSDIRGKGLDYALLTKDYNLLKWIGANAYRTSHYPYSEEAMDFADETGIMIVDECPSVDTENYSQALLEKHKASVEQLIHRDKNHPSVVMWSIANEPRTRDLNADAYFGAVAKYTKSLDPTRPITAAIAVSVYEDKAGKHLDILSFNRYNGWYANPGKLDMITKRVVEEATAWHNKYKIPVLMSEYGADTIEGLHLLPSFVWSEDYQMELFSKHFKAFDTLRKMGFFIGEFIWNFADFKTAQTVTRVGGNKKGIFTRNRQPKSSAYHVRRRYYALGKKIDNCSIPSDLHMYLNEDEELVEKSEL